MSIEVPNTAHLAARPKRQSLFVRCATIAAVSVPVLGVIAIGSLFLRTGGGGPFVAARSAPPELSALPPLPSAGRPSEGDTGEGYAPISAQTARDRNAARAFSTAPLVAAAPFRSQLAGDDYDRAVTCLAVAAVYEAGGSAKDQLPVMQVILNRVRHPAWPKSVCGVVFQGAERQTGCQFSFTCDGAMTRWEPSVPMLAAARTRAKAMLAGQVEKRVGLATHYHTDWVLPYWSDSLDKITAVDTHLFFRWNGYWGSRPAFKGLAALSEPAVVQLARFDRAHAGGLAIVPAGEQALVVSSGGLVAAGGTEIATPTTAEAGNASPFPVITVTLAPKDQPGRWSIDALAKCAKMPNCRVIGWVDEAARPGRITAETLAASPPDFVYVQQLRNRVRQAYWDCSRWSISPASRCLASGAETAALVL